MFIYIKRCANYYILYYILLNMHMRVNFQWFFSVQTTVRNKSFKLSL